MIIDRIFVERSFSPTNISYLPNESLHYFDPVTGRQLRDCAKNLYEKKEKYSVNEVFSCEIKFVIDI